MIIEHFILANNSSIDVNSNALSVFGLLDDMQLQAPAGVAINIAFHAILVVKRDGEHGPINSHFTLSITGPNKKKVGQELKIPAQLHAEHKRSRLRIIAELPITQSGTYTIRMFCNENESLSRELMVNVQVLPVAVPSPGSSFPQ